MGGDAIYGISVMLDGGHREQTGLSTTGGLAPVATWDEATTSIGTAIAALAALIAAGAAVAAVYVANNGLQATARQLQGTTLYNVAKDGQSLQREYLAKRADPNQVMSYFYSVFRLYTTHVIDAKSWVPVKVALCRFSKDTTVEDIPKWWASNRTYYDTDFRSVVTILQGAKAC